MFFMQQRLPVTELNACSKAAIDVVPWTVFLKFKNVMTKISDHSSSKKACERDYFSEVASHQLASLLKMDFFRGISPDFAYLLETPILMNTF